jgi:hypothetical protein
VGSHPENIGQSLYDLVTFVQRQGSFDPKTLRIATSEQLGSLLTNEETLRAVYEAEVSLHCYFSIY